MQGITLLISRNQHEMSDQLPGKERLQLLQKPEKNHYQKKTAKTKRTIQSIIANHRSTYFQTVVVVVSLNINSGKHLMIMQMSLGRFCNYYNPVRVKISFPIPNIIVQARAFERFEPFPTRNISKNSFEQNKRSQFWACKREKLWLELGEPCSGFVSKSANIVKMHRSASLAPKRSVENVTLEGN